LIGNNLKIKTWISAFRLRTLPLALASIAMGGFLAAHYRGFRLDVFVLTVLVATLLQILSNLANDYGDSKHGADHAHRKGPKRAVQSGDISSRSMKKSLFIFVILSLISGIWLLYEAFGITMQFMYFLGLGLIAIAAAIAYTNGKKPYGYSGLGDISVMIFFGFLGVLGSLYLHVLTIHSVDILLALSCGFFATAVLNINNIRDIESDKLAGKRTLPVRLGRKGAVVYHWLLLFLGFVSAFAFAVKVFDHWLQFIFLLTLPLFIYNGWAVKENREASQLDPYLKQMALSSLLFVLVFGIGLALSS
jgi:1,4-dihydroxy-2-naphthoate polyprenyltransferase